MVTDMVITEGNPADSTLAVPMVERHECIFGSVLRQVSMDGAFASKTNDGRSGGDLAGTLGAVALAGRSVGSLARDLLYKFPQRPA